MLYGLVSCLPAEGPKLLEFNARFGDPETQVIMPRLESDALEAFYMVATGKLDALDLRWTDQVGCVRGACKRWLPGQL